MKQKSNKSENTSPNPKTANPSIQNTESRPQQPGLAHLKPYWQGDLFDMWEDVQVTQLKVS